jgi:hypothetical protein
MSSSTTTPWPTPTGVAAVLDDVLHTDAAHPRPALRYLRRKPGRGLVAVYGNAVEDMYTVTVDEATASGQASSGAVAADPDSPEEDGVVRIGRLGVTIQRFPHDDQLPGLVDAVQPPKGGPLWSALAALSGARSGHPGVTLRSVSAAPLRYKPGDRCVIRYRLEAQTPAGKRVSFSVIGKLYRTLDQAHEASALSERLWALQGPEPWTARPLGVVDPLPLVLAEDLGSALDMPATVAGTEVLRMGTNPSSTDLAAAATALADLHLSAASLIDTPERTEAEEAGKAVKRAATISAYVPELAGEATAAAEGLCTALEASRPLQPRPAHGSYKPSQLLYRSGSVLLVDFDQFCMADPGLDLGYFLAYLRPPGIWYHRSGTRAWFEVAAGTFLAAYGAAAQARGMGDEELDGVLRRCHVYEAALLFKIAARRPNRLHSARPGEVRSLLDEVTACLAASEAQSGR